MDERHPATTNGPITADERTYLIEALQTTHDNLRQAVANLTEEQQHYQSAPNRWSIVQCLEHILLVERGIFRAVQQAATIPADPAGRARINVSDLFVIKAVRSRDQVVATPAPFVPTGRFGDVPSGLAAFDTQRAATLAFAETAPDDLRLRYFQHPFLGTLDLYQALLVIVSHGERHRKQINEIIASPGFPA